MGSFHKAHSLAGKCFSFQSLLKTQDLESSSLHVMILYHQAWSLAKKVSWSFLLAIARNAQISETLFFVCRTCEFLSILLSFSHFLCSLRAVITVILPPIFSFAIFLKHFLNRCAIFPQALCVCFNSICVPTFHNLYTCLLCIDRQSYFCIAKVPITFSNLSYW